MAKKQTKKITQNTGSQNEAPVPKPLESKPVENRIAGTSPLDQLNTWFKKRLVWVFCILVIGWIGVRVSYYNSIVESPLYSLYSHQESDNRFFDDWAKYLNTDWLNAKPMHPYHGWHKWFADYYFEKHPEKLKEILAASPNADTSFTPGKALWNEWYHGNQYHQEPLYPYLLAVMYHFHIDEVKTMIILQLILGILSGVLLFFITRKYFGETTAVLTGVLYFFCGILMYNEIILLRTSWIVFLTILNVFVMDRMFSKQRPLDFLLSGLCIGFAFLMQSTFLLFMIGALIIAFFIRKQNVTVYFKNAGVLLLGFAIMFAPVIIRNKIVGAPAFSTSSVGPPDIISCTVYGTITISGWAPSPEKETEILGQANQSLGKAMIATMKTYPSVGAYLYLEWRKLRAAWVGIEYPNNENYYFYRQYIPVLRFAGLNFFWIAPLGLAGLIFCIYYRKKDYALYLAIAIQMITLLLIFVLGRFRAPLVILLLPFAAFAIVECINVWNKKMPVVIAQIGIIVVLMILSFSGYSAAVIDQKINVGNYSILYETYFQDKLNEYAAKKQWDKWLEFQQQFIDMAPEYISNLTAGEAITNTDRVNIAQYFAGIHKERKDVYTKLSDQANVSRENSTISALNAFATNSLKALNASGENKDPGGFSKTKRNASLDRANSCNELGQYDSAIVYFNEFLGGDPKDVAIQKNKDNRDALYALAGIYITTKKYPKALELLREMVKVNPDDEKIQMRIGYAFLCNAQYDSSEVHSKRALQLNPKNTDAMNNLAGVYFFYKKYPLAIGMYKNAIEVLPDFVDPYANIGACYLYLNKYDSAIFYLNRAIIINRNYNAAYEILAATYKAKNKTDSAKKYEAIAQKNDPGFKL